MDDYDIPFEGMGEDEFLYRAMNEDDRRRAIVQASSPRS